MAHVHTVFSGDGELTPQELADLARARDFAAVLVADHFESLSPSRFDQLRQACAAVVGCLLVPGYERNWGGYHVLALGVGEWIDDADLDAWARRVHAAGGVTVLAHPSRYAHRVPDHVLAACDGVEVWNSKRGYDGAVGPNPAAYRLLGSHRLPVCGQDLHGRRHASAVALELARACTTAREILDQLRRGDYVMANRVWRFNGRLPTPVAVAFTVFHGGRRLAVAAAIAVRRFARMVRRRTRSWGHDA